MESPEQELVFTRVVDAPREKVFAAWTDPAHLAQWLAAGRWTITVAAADPRPGAVSLILMRRSGEVMTVTLTFEDAGGGTRYTARVRCWPANEGRTHHNIGLEIQ